MRGEVHAPDKLLEDGAGDFAKIESHGHAVTQVEDFQAHAVFAVSVIAMEISAALERPEDVAGGAFGDGQLAADLGVGKAAGAAGDGLQNAEGAFDCGSRAFLGIVHGRVLHRIPQNGEARIQNKCSKFCTGQSRFRRIQ